MWYDAPVPEQRREENSTLLPALTAVVALVAGGHPVVRCDLAGNTADGYSDGVHLVQVTPAVCRSANTLPKLRAAAGIDAVYDAAGALTVLLHEAWHVRLGGGQEGIVECEAIRTVPVALAVLVASRGLRARLAAAAREIHAELVRENPDYQAETCP